MGKRITQKRGAPNISGLSARIKKGAVAWLVMLPALICLYFFVWRPVAVGMGLSLFKLQGYEPVAFVGLKNYIMVMKDTLFVKTLINTFMYVFWSLVIGYFVPVFVAIILNEVVHGQGFFKFMIYLPTIIPGIAVSMIWLYVYQADSAGLLNQFIAMFGIEPQVWLQNSNWTIMLIIVSCTWKGMGATMLMYLAALQGIDQQLYEAAKLDGAGFFKRLWKITLPRISPMMLLLFIQQVIGIFQIMVEPMTMTGGGPNNASLSLALTGYNYAFQLFKTEQSLAVGTITFAILIVITSIYFYVQKKIEAE